MNEMHAFPEFRSAGPLRAMRKSDTCSLQGESHIQPSCKEPCPQRGEKQTQARSILSQRIRRLTNRLGGKIFLLQQWSQKATETCSACVLLNMPHLSSLQLCIAWQTGVLF